MLYDHFVVQKVYKAYENNSGKSDKKVGKQANDMCVGVMRRRSFLARRGEWAIIVCRRIGLVGKSTNLFIGLEVVSLLL